MASRMRVEDPSHQIEGSERVQDDLLILVNGNLHVAELEIGDAKLRSFESAVKSAVPHRTLFPVSGLIGRSKLPSRRSRT
jgi:hypothetical protein